ncbi:hypothetical protein [Streptomyces sp. NPDC000410]
MTAHRTTADPKTTPVERGVIAVLLLAMAAGTIWIGSMIYTLTS